MPLATSPISAEILPVPNSSANTNEAMRICDQLSPIDGSPSPPPLALLQQGPHRPRAGLRMLVSTQRSLCLRLSSRSSGLNRDLAGHMRVEHAEVFHIARLDEGE